MNDLEEAALKYISEQITKAERSGWFDDINYSNAERCVALLKEIQRYADSVSEGQTRDRQEQRK